METPTSYDQIIEDAPLAERQVVALEEQVAQQRRIADALEVLAATARFDALSHQVSHLALLQERGVRTPEREQALEQAVAAREDAREKLGVASPWR